MNARETCIALEFAHEVREESLELLRAIGRIGAPTGAEGRRAWFVATWLREQGATDVTVDEAHNVVCILGDRSEPGRAVFSAHTDIVFPATGELPLTEVEKALLDLFRKVPEDKQAMVIQMIRVALDTK